MKKKTLLIILISVVVVTSLSCNLPIGDRAVESPSGSDPSAGELPSQSQINPSYEFSPDQLTLIEEAGYPTRFSIIFGGTERQETWHYDTDGYSFVFINGEYTADQEVPVQYQENLYATTYRPDQFSRGMGLEEVLAATGKSEFTISQIEGMDRDLHLLHLEGLSIGLLEGKLSFVETYPAVNERKLTAEDFE